jgi:arylsulfatase A-like enzyme
MGWMDFSHNGSTFYETPNVDRLADEGMKFNQGYAACHVCSPTRASIMTGKYPARMHTTDWFCGSRTGDLPLPDWQCYMDTSEVTIAEALKEAGYATFFAGKWHLGPNETYWPQIQGFDINKGGHSAGGPYSGNTYYAPYNNPQLQPDGPEGEYLTDRLALETAMFIEDNKDGPFFAYLSFYTLHNPIVPRTDLHEKFIAKADTFNFGSEPEFVDVKWGYTARNVQKKPDYAAMVAAMDQAVGVVLDKLEELNLVDNTIVFYTADNGGLSTSEGQNTANTPLKAGKGWMYEGGIREPWIVKWPGITQAGSVVEDPVISTDFYPTILEIAGLDPRSEQHMDGMSLVPVLKQEAKLDRKAMYWHYPHYSNQGGRPASTIRMGDYKLIERFEDNSLELYNLAEDIGEENNLVGQAHVKDIQDLMLYKLHTWRADVGAQMNPGHVQQATPDTLVIAGCTNSRGINYNVFANQDDHSCIIMGCMDPSASNYDPETTGDDGSCIVGIRKILSAPMPGTIRYFHSSGNLEITIPGAEGFTFTIHDIHGTLVEEQRVDNHRVNVPADRFSGGMYFVTVIGHSFKAIRQVILY